MPKPVKAFVGIDIYACHLFHCDLHRTCRMSLRFTWLIQFKFNKQKHSHNI